MNVYATPALMLLETLSRTIKLVEVTIPTVTLTPVPVAPN